MQLTTHHRQNLLAELREAEGALEKERQIWNNRNKNSELRAETMEDFEAFLEIRQFLLMERIKLIEQSIINDYIDF